MPFIEVEAGRLSFDLDRTAALVCSDQDSLNIEVAAFNYTFGAP